MIDDETFLNKPKSMKPSFRVIPSVTKQNVQRRLQVLVGSIINEVRGLTCIIPSPFQPYSLGDPEPESGPSRDILPETQWKEAGLRQKTQTPPREQQNPQSKFHWQYAGTIERPS